MYEKETKQGEDRGVCGLIVRIFALCVQAPGFDQSLTLHKGLIVNTHNPSIWEE